MNRIRFAKLLLLLVACAATSLAVAAEPQLRAAKVSASLHELLQLDAPLWRAGVAQLKVRAVRNQEWVAFHIEWADPTRSDRIVVDNFGDQVAIELPVKP